MVMTSTESKKTSHLSIIFHLESNTTKSNLTCKHKFNIITVLSKANVYSRIEVLLLEKKTANSLSTGCIITMSDYTSTSGWTWALPENVVLSRPPFLHITFLVIVG